MESIGLILFAVGSTGSLGIWITAIRPYVRVHHEGYKTGANLGVAAWVDWQSCKDVARKNNDGRGIRLARIFEFFQVCTAAGVGLIVLNLAVGK